MVRDRRGGHLCQGINFLSAREAAVFGVARGLMDAAGNGQKIM
jgi:hypothetical protein